MTTVAMKMKYKIVLTENRPDINKNHFKRTANVLGIDLKYFEHLKTSN